jgi:LacI family repressor for deo operon, udp, cdd, tsx, nupC, and nupG
MQKKLPTIKEIARRLNVSASTVSRALHNHPSIGLRTKMQVQALAKELNYERNETAIFFQKGKTFTIGVVLPRFSEEFFSVAISGIEDFATKNKYQVLIGQSYDDMEREKQIVTTMKNSRIDGLIVSVAKNTSSFEHFENLRNYNIPVVFFDCIPDLPDQNSVSCNLQQGTMAGVDFLAEKGHKRIALINGPDQLQASAQRATAYLAGLKKNKIKEDAALMVRTDLSKESTYAAMEQLLQVKNPPTAIVAFNDYVALEAMQYARSRKLRINKDICFVSFAHLSVCNYLDNPPLASVEQFPYEQGYRAMELLYSIITDTENKHKPTQIVLESKLVPWGN